MPNQKNPSIKNVEEEHTEEIYEPSEPHYLTNEAIILRRLWDVEDSQRDFIPPPSPNSEYEFYAPTCHSFPESLPPLDDLEIPYVREKGVKFCIEHFGKFFGCVDYKINLLQFWFLDAVTDCVWTAQDEFQLPENLQKVVLGWFLYFIDLIRDPTKNVTRREFFETFKEAIFVASEVVEEGCDVLPTPHNLITLVEQNCEEEEHDGDGDGKEYGYGVNEENHDGDEEEEDDDDEEDRDNEETMLSSSSCSSIEITKEDYQSTNFVELGAENRHTYILSQSTWKYDKHELSSTDSFPESEITKTPPSELQKKKKRRLKDVPFYQADPNVPSRFLELLKEAAFGEEENEEEEEVKTPVSLCMLEEDLTGADGAEGHVEELAETFYVKSKQSLVDEEEALQPKIDDGLFVPAFKKSKKEILQELAVQKIWEQRLLDMDNPKKGWIPTRDELDAKLSPLKLERDKEEKEEESESSDESETSIDNYWIDNILNQQKELTEDNEDQEVINYGVIRAIIDFILKYFYESFQFMVVKLAFLGSPDTICQKLNEEWKIPKRIKVDLVKPKDPKPAKKKAGKEKKDKKGKKDKKKDKKKEKGAKKEKDKKKEKGKKDKASKKAKLTPAEKAELERLKREKALLEAEMLKIEENKRLLFPLDEAATDELFTDIFENWKRVNFKEKGKKDKKGKDKKGKGKK